MITEISTNHLLNDIKNVQIYPATKRLVPNFKLVKVTQKMDGNLYKDIVNGKRKGGIIEKKNHKNKGDVTTIYTISNSDGYENTDPLNITDYSVLSACASEYDAGNRFTTVAIILRALIGEVGNQNVRPRPDQYYMIMTSLKKLMFTAIEIDLSSTNETLKYSGNKKITSALLPAKIIETSINGKIVDNVIYFLDESPIMEIARARKQILTYDAYILNVPNQNNTPLVIDLKNYSIIRVLEIKLHNLTPTLTFADIFSKCRIDGLDNKTKSRAREYVLRFFEHLQNLGEIKSFEITKKGNAFYSIQFTY
jgi:hypothetical protein